MENTLKNKLPYIDEITKIIDVEKGDGRINLRRDLRGLEINRLAGFANTFREYGSTIDRLSYEERVSLAGNISLALKTSHDGISETVEIHFLAPLEKKVNSHLQVRDMKKNFGAYVEHEGIKTDLLHPKTPSFKHERSITSQAIHPPISSDRRYNGHRSIDRFDGPTDAQHY